MSAHLEGFVGLGLLISFGVALGAQWWTSPEEIPRKVAARSALPSPVTHEQVRSMPAPAAVQTREDVRELPDEAQQLAELWDAIDAARASGGTCGPTMYGEAPLLEGSRALDNAAWSQADYMARADVWAHETPGNPAGETPSQRAAHAGYDGRFAGEVLAWGQHTPEEAVDWWLHSPPHCRALLDPNSIDGGAAVVPDPQTEGYLWVVVLGMGDS